MVSAAVFCPHPPALIPAVAQGAAAELDDLRTICRAAIQRVAKCDSEVLVIGSGPVTRRYGPTARGSLAGFGVDLEIPLGSDAAGPVALPLSLTIGAWLLRDALGPGHGAHGLSTASPGRVVEAEPAPHRVLLVMGDGSARRSATAPGYLDERAAPFDAAAVAALRSGAPERLRVDASLGAELLAALPAPWAAAATELAGATYDADVLYDAAPYGVGYFVGTWVRRD
jgi:hypothetical protein